MNFKLVTLDLDGTAFKPLDGIVESNIEPIKKALKKGVKVAFVTGRPIHGKLNKLDELDFLDEGIIFAGFNGAQIYDLKHNKVLDENPLDKNMVLKAFELINTDEDFKEVELWAYTVDDKLSYINRPVEGSVMLGHELHFFDFEPVIFKEGMEMLDCHKILAMNTNHKYCDALREIGFSVNWSPSAHAAEITKKGIDKKYALEFLAKKYSIQKEEILAMGDGANDLPMFAHAGFSIAPANAPDDIKKHASEVSEYTDIQGAVGKAIEKYILND